MKVLVACEESQRVCISFRERGHEAYSCDIVDCSGGHPEWHIKDDALKVIEREHWDLIIAHPPCTYLSNAGACRLYPHKGQLDMARYAKGLEAKEFFMKILNADCEKICIENPVPSRVFELPKYTQIIQPFQFGEPWSKRTCLWLKGLPKLKDTELVVDFKPYVSCGTSANKGNPDKAGFSRAGGDKKVRSTTFWGIARAMENNGGKKK